MAPYARLAALALCVCVLPHAAFAQRTMLQQATVAASAAAAADWVSTYHALKYYQVRESNPLIRGMDGSPGPMVSVGAMIDAGGISAWNVVVGRPHPRIAATGLWAMTAFRTYLAIHNIRNEQRAARR